MRLNVVASGLGFGVFWAIGIVGVTIISGLTNSPGGGVYSGYGGEFIKVIMSVYPGYGISALGAVIGGLWSLADGFISAAVLAMLYNYFAFWGQPANGSEVVSK